jgi:hypothetical protein
MIEESAG